MSFKVDLVEIHLSTYSLPSCIKEFIIGHTSYILCANVSRDFEVLVLARKNCIAECENQCSEAKQFHQNVFHKQQLEKDNGTKHSHVRKSASQKKE